MKTKTFPNHRAHNRVLKRNFLKMRTLDQAFTKMKTLVDLLRGHDSLYIRGVPLKDFQKFQKFYADSEYYNADSEFYKNPSFDFLYFDIFEKFPDISVEKQKLYKQFFDICLHQGFYYNTCLPLEKWQSNILLTGAVAYTNILVTEQAIYLVVSITYNKYRMHTGSLVGKGWGEEESCFVETKTAYEVKLSRLLSKEQWEATVGLVTSQVQCDERFQSFLDERSYVEKFIDLIVEILRYLKCVNLSNDINSEEFLRQAPSITSRPMFFKSSADGTSVETISDTPTPRPSTTI